MVKTVPASFVLWVLAMAGLVACGGGGGGGHDVSPLPLRAEDLLVSPMSPGTTSNEVLACHAGAKVYVVWAERSNSAPDAVRFNRSLDGGATWLADPIRVGDPLREAGRVAIACDGDRVFIAYRSSLGNSSEIRLDRSIDAGTTFLPTSVRVSDVLGPGVLPDTPALCCEGDTVHVAWADGRNGARDVFYNRSTDGGASFPDPDLPIETDVPGGADSHTVHMCCDGLHVYVAWIDLRDGLDQGAVRLSSSLDGGATFLPDDVSVTHAATPTIGLTGPDVVCAGSTVDVVWSDERNGLGDVFFNRSLDGGLTFQPIDTRLDTDAPGATASFDPVACLVGSVVHVAWSDQRSPTSSVRYRRSEDAGGTFLAEDVGLPSVPVEPGAHQVRLACEGATVAVAWETQPMPPDQPDILLAVSTDGGRSFEGARADTDAQNASLSFEPQPCVFGDRIVVLWGEQRAASGDVEVRANRTAR